jgi:hypothetical protein
VDCFESKYYINGQYADIIDIIDDSGSGVAGIGAI